jgi:hypothetical protein
VLKAKNNAMRKKNISPVYIPLYHSSCFFPGTYISNAQVVEDKGWPGQIIKNGSTLIYYQPQVDDWKDHKKLSGQMAFSLLLIVEGDPVLTLQTKQFQNHTDSFGGNPGVARVGSFRRRSVKSKNEK